MGALPPYGAQHASVVCVSLPSGSYFVELETDVTARGSELPPSYEGTIGLLEID